MSAAVPVLPDVLAHLPRQRRPAEPHPLPRRLVDVPRGAVAEALAAVRPERLVGLLQELLAVPSVTGSAAESEAQHLVARHLDRLGMATDLWSIDLESTVADPAFPGLEAPREEAWGLVGSWTGAGDGPVVVLNGHVDVVPAGERLRWSEDPWSGTVRGGAVHGRGACDMKGGLVCQLVALEALREAGVRLGGTVQLQSVVSEEDGGLGAFATLSRGYRGDLAVICEPTSGALVPAHAGALTFRLVVPGLSTHASVRLDGVDAVEKYLLVHEALRRLEARRNRDPHPLMARYALPYPLSVGTVRAGNWASSVPEELVAEGRLGVALGEPVEHARAELEHAIATVCAGDTWLREHPVRVEWFGGQFASGGVAPDSSAAQLVTDAHQLLHGERPQVHGAPYGSDLRLLTAGGTPTVLYGPGDVRADGPGDVRAAHAPDENVPVDDLVRTTQTLVLLLASVLGR